MQKYNQLSLQDRHKIKALLDGGHHQSDVADFVPPIVNFSKKDFKQIHFDLDLDEVKINVNQALTYSLLLNEFLSHMLKAGMNINDKVTIQILKMDEQLLTKITVGTDTDFLKTKEGVGKQLIKVLLAQLGADLNTQTEDEFTNYKISFELKDKKGITSSKNY
ncbi:MAG: hypothetical protein WD059_08885 [Balneolaceae bacterium]